MCSHQILCVESNLAKTMTEHWKPQEFGQSFDIFYKGQIPNIAIFLIKGSVIQRKNGIEKEFFAPALIGANELLESRVSDCSMKILNGSVASVFDRPSLTKYLKNNKSLKKLLGMKTDS